MGFQSIEGSLRGTSLHLRGIEMAWDKVRRYITRLHHEKGSVIRIEGQIALGKTVHVSGEPESPAAKLSGIEALLPFGIVVFKYNTARIPALNGARKGEGLGFCFCSQYAYGGHEDCFHSTNLRLNI